MKSANTIQRFLHDESGAISIMILPMFLLLALLGGLAIDVYSEETFREDLQDSIDRGTLAAASLAQTLDAEDVVQAYVDVRTFTDTEVAVNVVEDETLTSRLVTAHAGYDMPTVFWSLAGLRTMPVIARSAAFEGEEDVEISLVLDISGSMSRETSSGTGQKRLAILRDAASDFVEGILNRPNAAGISISVVPYSGQVNAGLFFDALHSGATTFPSYANHCIEFTDADFATAALPAANSRLQTPQFQNFRFEGHYGHQADWGWCPKDSRAILPFSKDLTALQNFIGAFRAHDGTGTNNGMKWGLALLDPSTQPLVANLAATGQINADFADRPASYSATRTAKIIVLMTDGNIRYQNRPTANEVATRPEYWGDGPRYNSSGRVKNTLLYSSNEHYYSTLPGSSDRTNDENLRSQQFLALCNIARNKGIHVFTIGYDISSSSDAYSEMRNCATVPGNFFDVDGLDLHTAFSQITTYVQKLQLIQ